MSPKSKLAISKSPFIRTENWGKFTPGAPVKIVSGFLKGRRGQHWEFRCHVLNPLTNDEWLEIFGGTRKDPDSVRAVKTEDIQLIKQKPKTHGNQQTKANK